MKRRDFLRYASCGAMGSTSLLSALTSLGSVNGAVSNTVSCPGDYKAIVCILLAGGMDSYNVLIPTGNNVGGDNGFQDYLDVRTSLAITDRNSIHNLNSSGYTNFRGRTSAYENFGLHPGMPELATLFNSGKAAIMSNIGTLVEPVADYTAYRNSNTKLPLGIYSHSDQIMQWQTSVPQSRDALGMGGRLADIMNASNCNENISMNISLSGKNVFQRGNSVSEYSIRNNINPSNVGFESLPAGWSNSGLLNDLRNAAVDSMVSESYANILQQSFSNTMGSSIQAFDVLKEALKKVPTIAGDFTGTGRLGADLSAIARMISVRQEIGMRRQVFFVTLGGWDMHNNLLGGLGAKLPEVSKSLAAFNTALEGLGVGSDVTTFTISDFARTITSNGQGSDHAWGGNSIVMGGAVNAGLYGAYPRLDVNNNPQNVSFRGNFIPAMSTDEFYAEIALWYGVSPNDLQQILPNLSNFYTHSLANPKPVGFMNY